MLANQNLLIVTMQAGHRHTESVLGLLTKVCTKLNVSDVGDQCEQLRTVLKDTDSMFATLRDASTADLSQVLSEVKKYATDVVTNESKEVQAVLKNKADATEADVNDRFKKLESRVLSELAGGTAEVLERYEALKNEVAPLHSRADAAAARLDRLGVQATTTSKDCMTLNKDFTDAVVEVRAILAEQEKKRGETEQALRVLIQESSDALASKTQTVLEQAEDQHRKQMSAESFSAHMSACKRCCSTGSPISRKKTRLLGTHVSVQKMLFDRFADLAKENEALGTVAFVPVQRGRRGSH